MQLISHEWGNIGRCVGLLGSRPGRELSDVSGYLSALERLETSIAKLHELDPSGNAALQASPLLSVGRQQLVHEFVALFSHTSTHTTQPTRTPLAHSIAGLMLHEGSTHLSPPQYRTQ